MRNELMSENEQTEIEGLEEPKTAIEWIEPSGLDPADHSPRLSLIRALVEAKKGIGTLEKDSVNPLFDSAYTSLGGAIAAIDPHLLEAGIVVVQGIRDVDGRTLPETEPINVNQGQGQAKWIDRPTGKQIDCPAIMVTTEAVHVDGASIRISSVHEVEARKGTNWMQDMKTIVSYARRTHILTLFCLGEQDDDANSAGKQNPGNPGYQSGARGSGGGKTISDAQAGRYYAICKSLGVDHDPALELLKRTYRGTDREDKIQSASDVLAGEEYDSVVLRVTKSIVFQIGEQDPDAFEDVQAKLKTTLKDADQKGAEKLGKELQAEIKRRKAAEEGE